MEEKFLAAWGKTLDRCEALGVRTKRTRQNLSLQQARRILDGRRCSDEFAPLAQLGHLELSLENVVLAKAFGELFTDDQINTALTRLLEAGYKFL